MSECFNSISLLHRNLESECSTDAARSFLPFKIFFMSSTDNAPRKKLKFYHLSASMNFSNWWWLLKWEWRRVRMENHKTQRLLIESLTAIVRHCYHQWEINSFQWNPHFSHLSFIVRIIIIDGCDDRHLIRMESCIQFI